MIGTDPTLSQIASSTCFSVHRQHTAVDGMKAIKEVSLPLDFS